MKPSFHHINLKTRTDIQRVLTRNNQNSPMRRSNNVSALRQFPFKARQDRSPAQSHPKDRVFVKEKISQRWNQRAVTGMAKPNVTFKLQTQPNSNQISISSLQTISKLHKSETGLEPIIKSPYVQPDLINTMPVQLVRCTLKRKTPSRLKPQALDDATKMQSIQTQSNQRVD